jgi:hypothetical protein
VQSVAKERQQPAAQASTTPTRFAETTPPIGYDHSFPLQTVLELQKSIGQMGQAIQTLTEDSKENRRKLDRLSHIIYAAGVVGTVLLGSAVWILDKLSAVALAYFSSHKQ